MQTALLCLCGMRQANGLPRTQAKLAHTHRYGRNQDLFLPERMGMNAHTHTHTYAHTHTYPLEVSIDPVLTPDHIEDERQRCLAKVSWLEERQFEEGVDEVWNELSLQLLQLVPHHNHQLAHRQTQVAKPAKSKRKEVWSL